MHQPSASRDAAVGDDEPARSAPRGRTRLLVEVRYVDRAARRRTVLLAVVLGVVGLVLFDIALAGVLTRTGVELLDRPVDRWFTAQRDADATTVMAVLATVFGPVGMPIVVAATLILWIVLARHLWRPVLLLGGMVTGVLLAQAIAPLVRHPRPPVARMLLGPDHTFSFPSGHVLGMSDFFLITAFLLASRVRRPVFTAAATAVAIVCVIAQAVARLYLGYHWLTDVVGSVSLSMIIVGVVILIDTRRTVRVQGEPVGGGRSVLQRDGT